MVLLTMVLKDTCSKSNHNSMIQASKLQSRT